MDRISDLDHVDCYKLMSRDHNYFRTRSVVNKVHFKNIIAIDLVLTWQSFVPNEQGLFDFTFYYGSSMITS